MSDPGPGAGVDLATRLRTLTATELYSPEFLKNTLPELQRRFEAGWHPGFSGLSSEEVGISLSLAVRVTDATGRLLFREIFEFFPFREMEKLEEGASLGIQLQELEGGASRWIQFSICMRLQHARFAVAKKMVDRMNAADASSRFHLILNGCSPIGVNCAHRNDSREVSACCKLKEFALCLGYLGYFVELSRKEARANFFRTSKAARKEEGAELKIFTVKEYEPQRACKFLPYQVGGPFDEAVAAKIEEALAEVLREPEGSEQQDGDDSEGSIDAEGAEDDDAIPGDYGCPWRIEKESAQGLAAALDFFSGLTYVDLAATVLEGRKGARLVLEAGADSVEVGGMTFLDLLEAVTAESYREHHEGDYYWSDVSRRDGSPASGADGAPHGSGPPSPTIPTAHLIIVRPPTIPIAHLVSESSDEFMSDPTSPAS